MLALWLTEMGSCRRYLGGRIVCRISCDEFVGVGHYQWRWCIMFDYQSVSVAHFVFSRMAPMVRVMKSIPRTYPIMLSNP